jgi:DNA repair protein SbcD/Mre11
MRIAHLADLHLGYRAYNRMTSQGVNWREADVFNGFRQALVKVAEIQPDLIIIAGDLFHSVRPSNLCIQQTFRAFLDLRAKQSCDAPMIIIGGNHDSPRSTDTGCILDLFANVPGIHVVHREYLGVKIPDLDTTVFCLCHSALPSLRELKLEPDAGSKHSILTAHGAVEGIARDFTDQYMISPEQILSDSWDYVALGHYHMYRKLLDNAYYSGSTDFTSFNIWEEAGDPKGFIEYDTDKRQATFHELATRSVVDLRPIDAREMTAKELDDMLQSRISGVDGGHTDKIIRQVVEGLPRQTQKDIDYGFIRKIKSEALHFEVQFRPIKRESSIADLGERTPARSLEIEWREFIGDSSPLPGGVEREALVELGLKYLGQTERATESM